MSDQNAEKVKRLMVKGGSRVQIGKIAAECSLQQIDLVTSKGMLARTLPI